MFAFGLPAPIGVGRPNDEEEEREVEGGPMGAGKPEGVPRGVLEAGTGTGLLMGSMKGTGAILM